MYMSVVFYVLYGVRKNVHSMNNTVPHVFRISKTTMSHCQILILYYGNFDLLNLIRLNNIINYT